jgi:hypothetical protein
MTREELQRIEERRWQEIVQKTSFTPYKSLRARFTQQYIDQIKNDYHYFRCSYEDAQRTIEATINSEVTRWSNNPHVEVLPSDISRFRSELNINLN